MSFEVRDPKELSLINSALAEFVGVPKSTIDRAATQDRLQTFYIGTAGETRVVRIADVLDWKRHHYKPEPGQRKESSPRKGKSQ